MGLEAGDYISDLIETNPSAQDKRRQGDDHIRLIKKTVKGTFPNLNGPVIVTPLELNRISGLSGPIMGLLETKLEANALTPYLRGDINQVRVRSHACSPVDLGSVTGALSFDVGLSEFWRATVVGNITGISFTNITPGVVFNLKLIHGGGGDHTVTWGSQIHFPGKVAPVFTPGLNNYDILRGYFIDNALVCEVLQNVGVGA